MMHCQMGVWPLPVYSPYSSRSSASSLYGDFESTGSRSSDYYCGSSSSDISEDSLGLKGLIHLFYAPQLESELERLFGCHEPGRGSPDSLSPSYNHKSVWDDFQNNGQDAQLDDLDKLFRGMASSISNIVTEDQNGSAESSSDSSEPPSPPLEGNPQANGIGSTAVQEILTKAHLIDILREREQLQRSTRSVKRVVMSGNGLLSTTSVGVTKTPTPKSVSGKVCVFCRNNGEPEAVYSSHQLKDPEGNVTCPILYIYTCPICGANGKQSHTIKYCPYNAGDSLSMKSLIKTTSSSALTPTSSVLLRRGIPLL